jgi:hypothetical protein
MAFSSTLYISIDTPRLILFCPGSRYFAFSPDIFIVGVHSQDFVSQMLPVQVWEPVPKLAASLKAGMVIVEGKIKPETYTADGAEHKTFSIKADYIRKIDYSAPSEARESKAAKLANKAK